MYKTFKILFGLSLYLIFTASTCEEPIDLAVDDGEAKLVLISEMTPGKPIEVYIYKNNSVLEEADNFNAKYPKDANIRILSNGEVVDVLQYSHNVNQSTTPKYIGGMHNAEINQDYTIKVDVENFDHISATSKIPEKRLITDFSVLEHRQWLVNTNRFKVNHQYLLHVGAEKLAKDNYYLLQLAYSTENNHSGLPNFRFHEFELANVDGNPRYIENYFDEGILIDGNDITGNELSFKMKATGYTNSNTEMIKELFIEVKSVSKDYFLFYKSASLQQQQSEGDSLFMESTILHSNVKNGFGFFGGYISDRDTILLN